MISPVTFSPPPPSSSIVSSTFCLPFVYPLAHLSPHISLHTAFGFLFSDKCGFSTERLILNKRRDTVENVAGMAFLLAADRVQTGSYIGLDYIIGDTGISQGRYAKNRQHWDFATGICYLANKVSCWTWFLCAKWTSATESVAQNVEGIWLIRLSISHPVWI